jgi:hypothetical protein
VLKEKFTVPVGVVPDVVVMDLRVTEMPPRPVKQVRGLGNHGMN